MTDFALTLEVAGPLAMFTRVDTGGTPTSYPAPTWSAAKGLFDSIALLSDAAAFISPRRAEILKPRSGPGGAIRYESYATNYGGPLRKGSLVRAGNNMQLFATVLVDVRYRLHAVVNGAPRVGHNPRHHLHDLFLRRLDRGQCFQTPALGWREFTCSYWGPARDDTEIDTAVNLAVPSMLVGIWDRPVGGAYHPRYAQDARIENGLLHYA